MTREQRKAAKVARRRRRNEQMRVTPRRVNVLEDGTSVLIEAKVRGPRNGATTRAMRRAALMRKGEDILLGTKGQQQARAYKRWFRRLSRAERDLLEKDAA